MNKRVTAILFCSLAICCWGTVEMPDDAEPSIRQIDYHGWQRSWMLSNGKIEIVLVPEISRVMSFSFCHDKNVLWENRRLRGHQEDLATGQWLNYGGSKLWIAPQAKWPEGQWPPDVCLDRSPCTVESQAGTVSMTGGKSPFSGLQMTKSVTVVPNQPGVRICNTIRNVSNHAVEWSIWEVTQLPPRGRILAPTRPGTKITTYTEDGPERNRAVISVMDGWLTMETAQAKGRRGVKTALMQDDGWLAYLVGNVIFLKKFSPTTAGQLPPACANSEIYANANYVELETIGPYRKLNPGDRCTYVEEWYLLAMPQAVEDAKIMDSINRFLRQLSPSSTPARNAKKNKVVSP